MADIITITDFNAPELDIFARMSENQLLNRDKPEDGIFIAESPKVVERALDAGYEPVSVLVEDRHIETEAKNVIERVGDVPVFTASFDVLAELTGYKLTRGVLCAMKRKPLPSMKNILEGSRRVAVLENIMNPTNVGAIIRSAAALGIDGVILSPNCSNPLYRRAIRVSMGTVFQIPWTIAGCEWPEEGMKIIKDSGFRSVAFALRNDSVGIDDEELKNEDKLAVILGSEGDGLCDFTMASCDYTVKIPMYHNVDSLNVAAASAVAFWELCKR